MLADRVEVLIDSSFADTSGWGDDGLVGKGKLLGELDKVPSTFRCIRVGKLLVTPNATQKVYRVRGTNKGGKLASISIQLASEGAQACND